MKEFRVLKFLDRFRSVFGKFGIEYGALRKILQLKLTMDARRVPTAILNNKKKDEEKNTFISALFVYGLIGLFTAFLIFLPMPMYFKMNFSIGMIIFMVMTTMISDFSAVLLDIKEKNILLPRPVNLKTINAAKVIHIAIYLSGITGAIAGPSLIAGLIRYGAAFFFIFLVELILICGFVIFFTSMLYTLILVFFDGEKLKDIINYFQIILSIFLVVFYQLIGRVFDISKINITISPEWWHYLIPSTWFAAPYSLLIEHNSTGYNISLSIMAVVIPLFTLFLYIKYVVPYFEKNLQKLNDNSGKRKKSFEVKFRRLRKLAAVFCADKNEQLFFRFTQLMVSNERKLKLKLYPSLAFSAVMPFLLMSGVLSGAKSLNDLHNRIVGGYYYLGLYFTAVLLAGSIMMLGMSERYKGAWIYKVLPLESPAIILRGAFKGFLMKFMIPVYFIASLLFLLIFGIRIIPDILLIFANMLILTLFIYKCSKKELPFYKDFQFTQDGGNVTMTFLSFVLAGVLGGIHFGLTFVPFGITANIAVSMLLAAFLWHSGFKLNWNDIKRDAA